MRYELTKDEQKELMWRWAEDPSLHLVYKSFDNFVKIVSNTKELLNGG